MDEFHVNDYESESEEEVEGPFMEDDQDLDARIEQFIEEESEFDWLHQLENEVERAFMEEDTELGARIHAMEESELDIECLLEIQNEDLGVFMEDDPELEQLQYELESAFMEDDLDVGARIRAMEEERKFEREWLHQLEIEEEGPFMEDNPEMDARIRDMEEERELESEWLQQLHKVDHPELEAIEARIRAIEEESKMWKLDYISKKIEAKEKDLECPVCLEVASTPIFKCPEDHLICSVCRPKVSRCPECRLWYYGVHWRHRLAEKAVEELEELRREMAEVLRE